MDQLRHNTRVETLAYLSGGDLVLVTSPEGHSAYMKRTEDSYVPLWNPTSCSAAELLCCLFHAIIHTTDEEFRKLSKQLYDTYITLCTTRLRNRFNNSCASVLHIPDGKRPMPHEVVTAA